MIAIDKLIRSNQFSDYPELNGPFRFVFNTDRFLRTKRDQDIDVVRYRLNHRNDGPISIAFSLLGQKAISGYQATFGGIDCNGIDENAILLLDQVETNLKERGIKECHIRMWPEYIDGGIWTKFFTDKGYNISQIDINHHLILEPHGFLGKVSKDKIKKLRLCETQGLRFKKLGLEFLDQVYELVEDSRKRRGFPVTMNLTQLRKVFAEFPDKYSLFGVFDGTVLVAGAVTIFLNDQIAYNFYHGDRLSHRLFSPTVLLVKGIYSHCQTKGLKVLDLGISSEAGRINPGLHTFKKRLGCLESRKLIFTRHF